jgi:hypothetical protein
MVVGTKKVGMKGQYIAKQRWAIVMDRNNTEPDWLREMRRSDFAAQANLQVHVGHERARVVMRKTATV